MDTNNLEYPFIRVQISIQNPLNRPLTLKSELIFYAQQNIRLTDYQSLSDRVNDFTEFMDARFSNYLTDKTSEALKIILHKFE